ncbi:DNA-binding protein [Clavibacter michiganensis]|nr:DNA-binding protein [Clavibacter michiganensis]
MDDSESLPDVGASARRGLEAAGIHTLADVREAGLDQVATLHGVGPKALRILEIALND